MRRTGTSWRRRAHWLTGGFVVALPALHVAWADDAIAAGHAIVAAGLVRDQLGRAVRNCHREQQGRVPLGLQAAPSLRDYGIASFTAAGDAGPTLRAPMPSPRQPAHGSCIRPPGWCGSAAARTHDRPSA